MIKVGQIYRGKTKENTILITKINKSFAQYDYIWKDGTTVSCDDLYFVKLGRKLIAEYPTWQEAVNSKEFKGE